MSFSSFHNQTRLGFLLGFGGLVFSGTYTALAKGLTPYLTPISLLVLSEALTALFILITFGFIPLLKKCVELDGRTLRMCIFVGLINSAIAPLLWFTGLTYTTAINATMLSTMETVACIVLSHYFLSEHMTRTQGAGMLSIMVGIIIVNVSGMTDGFAIHMGDLYILLGSLFYGVGSVLFKKYLSHVMPELTIVIRNVTGIAAVLILSFFISHSVSAEVVSFPLQQVVALLAFAFFSRYLTLTFYYESLDRLPATTLSLINLASPLTGIFFAFLILGEGMNAAHVLGGIFMIVGLVLEQTSHRSTRVRHHFGFLHVPFHRPHVIVTSPTIKIIPARV